MLSSLCRAWNELKYIITTIELPLLLPLHHYCCLLLCTMCMYLIITCLHGIWGLLWNKSQIRTCPNYSIFCLQVARNQTLASCQNITAGRPLSLQLISHFPNKFAFNQITETDRYVANLEPLGPSGTISNPVLEVSVYIQCNTGALPLS